MGRGCRLDYLTHRAANVLMEMFASVLLVWAHARHGMPFPCHDSSVAHARSGSCVQLLADKLKTPKTKHKAIGTAGSSHFRLKSGWGWRWHAPDSGSSTCPKGSFAVLCAPGRLVCEWTSAFMLLLTRWFLSNILVKEKKKIKRVQTRLAYTQP